MKILFLYDRPFLPQIVGGTEHSINDLCLVLRSFNVEAIVVCNIYASGMLWLTNRLISKILKIDFPCDFKMNYPVYRGWCTVNSIDKFIERFNPDTVVIKNGVNFDIINLLIKKNIKIVNYVRDLNDSDDQLYPNENNISYIANSNFTKKKVKEKYGISSTVIPPLIFKDRFKINGINGKKITFIGLDSKKGVDLAFDIAEQMPSVSFQFYESWTLNNIDFLMYQNRGNKLGNVDVKKRTLDVSSIYNDTKILLFPSQCEETWGRVASEAHLFGIPVVGSNIGGIPESVGPGGILVPPSAPVSDWVTVINSMIFDDHVYNSYSMKALKYSQRSEFQPIFLVNKFLSICNS